MLSAAYRFQDGRLESVDIRRPEADIGFFARAVDHVGKASEARSSFREERNEYCESPYAEEIICR